MWLLLLRKALTVHRLTIRRLPHDEVCPLCLSGMKLMNILHWNFCSLKGCAEFFSSWLFIHQGAENIFCPLEDWWLATYLPPGSIII